MGANAVQNLATPFLHTEGLNSKTEKFIHETTLYVLIAFAFFMASKPLFGTAIVCQVPKDWPESSIQYFNTYCYYSEKTRVGVMRFIDRGESRGNMTVNVLTGTADNYLWIPFVGFLQVALCLLPALFWRFVGLSAFHGCDMTCLLETFREEKGVLNERGWFDANRAYKFREWINEKSHSVCGKSRTMTVYVLMKWLRFVVFVFQFWLNARLFANGDMQWGYKIARDFFKGIYINPLTGEFTLITGCETQRLHLSVGYGRTIVNSVTSRCILSSNFINSKVFIFLYWWFAVLLVLSYISALRYTAILLSNRYRRHLFKSLIRNDSYYTTLRGPPSPEIDLGNSDPIDYLSDYLGNDGYLCMQIVFDMLHYHAADKLTMDLWTLIVSKQEHLLPTDKKNGKVEKVKEDGRPIGDMEHDGSGDRFRGGKEKRFTEDETFIPTAPIIPSIPSDSGSEIESPKSIRDHDMTRPLLHKHSSSTASSHNN